MDVHGLDELSLLYIFDLLSISDLLIAGQVCSRWNVFRAKSGLTRHSLTLRLYGERSPYFVLNNFYLIPHYQMLKNDDGSRMFPDGTYPDDLCERHQLNLPELLNVQYASVLVELFPAITNLVVGMYIETGHVMDTVAYMLKQWRSSLVSLKIHARYENDNNKKSDQANVDSHQRLLQAVNRLSSLERLDVDVKFSFIKNILHDRIDLPILAQLKELYFYTSDELKYIFDSLKQYGESNERLKKICLNSPIYYFDKLTTLSPEFSSRFFSLSVGLLRSNIANFMSLTNNFTNLSTLVINLGQIDMVDAARRLVFGSLAALTQLVHLHLLTDGRMLDSLKYFEDERQQDYVQLKSVKVLTLRIVPPSVTTHHIFLQLDFGWLFPKLQVVKFFGADKLCGQCTADGQNHDDAHQNRCLKTMIVPFRQCTQLQMVVTSRPVKVWLSKDLQD